MTDQPQRVNHFTPRKSGRHRVAKCLIYSKVQPMRWMKTLCCLVALGGCLPLQTYYRAGASVAQLQSDQLACEVKALKDAPVAVQTRIGPPHYIPARKHCNHAGKCVVKGGFWVRGDVYNVDVNAELRERVELQCMAGRGYEPASIPACPPGIAQSAPQGVTDVLPPLTAQSCVIRNQNGTIQIVTRG